VALRWAVAWATVGLVVSVFALLHKIFYFTEASAGLDGGIAYTGLLTVSADWRDSLEGEDWKTRLGPYALCGATAGLIPGFLVGGLTGALFFAVLGGCTALALTWIEIRTELHR
jgi:hypothetical protein